MNINTLIKFSLFIVAGLLIASCDNSISDNGSEKVASVYENYLYLDDVVELIPDNLSTADSTEFASSIINNWITRQLKLHNAEMNLSDEKKDVENELEEYRSSLLIYKYEQEYIRQKLDTNVSDNELLDYYNSFNKEFVLKNDIVIASLAVIPVEVDSYTEFRRWFISGKDKYISDIAAFCERYAVRYSNYNEEWTYFDHILRDNPFEVKNQELDLKYKRYFELEKDGNYYLLYIHSYTLQGNIAPLNLVERDIVNILLNKRKLNLIRELEENTFNHPGNFKNIKIFKN